MWYHRMAQVQTSPISNAWRVMSSKLSHSMGSPFVNDVAISSHETVKPGLKILLCQ